MNINSVNKSRAEGNQMKNSEPNAVRQTIIHKHSLNCWAMQKYGGDWLIEATLSMQRDRIGRKRPAGNYNRFILFRCNDVGCPAQMVVLEYDIAVAAGIHGRTQVSQ